MVSSDNNLTYEFHKELNSAIWSDGELNTSVKDKLLEIATAFLETIDIEVDVEDVTLTGSLANYNYTKYSDFDLHIITDYKDYDVDVKLLKDYFNIKKTVWNTNRDITIKGYDVEVYIQDASEPHHSTGVYSLKNDEWISEPKPTTTKQDIDAELVNKKKQAMLDIINYALSSECDVECADNAKKKFMGFRKAGLEMGGELSPENLAFKELRRTGDVERLVKGIIGKKNKKLSLDSIQENSFKSFMGLGTKRGPRHQSLTAGINKLTNPQSKTIGIVADMHKVQGHPLVHQLKKQNDGFTVIPLATANELVTMYGLDMSKIRNGEPRKLSTSNIELGYNSRLNTFYLRK